MTRKILLLGERGRENRVTVGGKISQTAILQKSERTLVRLSMRKKILSVLAQKQSTVFFVLLCWMYFFGERVSVPNRQRERGALITVHSLFCNRD